MAKPDEATVGKWRSLAEDGYLYAEIARMYPQYTVDQVRHYCLGHTGRKLPGPIQKVDRWYGSNVWLRGENSPHSELTEKQARRVLDDWDEKNDRWKKSGAEWALSDVIEILDDPYLINRQFTQRRVIQKQRHPLRTIMPHRQRQCTRLPLR